MRHKIFILFSLIAVIIITDFTLPGKVFTKDIIAIKKEKQQYYNAAKNYHFSYELTTNKHQFLVTKDFVKSNWKNNKVDYSVSLVFKEVNWYKLTTSTIKSYYSLRILSGFIFPLLVLTSMAFSYYYKKNIDIFISVLQALLFADLIYLIL